MTLERHSAVTAILQHFEYDHLGDDLREYSKRCHDLAHWMADNIPDDPQLTLGLHDLLRAKDCFVRAVIASREELNI